MTTDWISVKDRLPVEEGSYRVIRTSLIMMSGRYKTTAYFDGKKWLLLNVDVTHWLESPPEPPMPEVTE